MEVTLERPESIPGSPLLDVLHLLKSVTGIQNWAVKQYSRHGSRLAAYVGSKQLAEELAGRDGCYQGQCAIPLKDMQKAGPLQTCLRIPLLSQDAEVGTLCGFGPGAKPFPGIDWDAAHCAARLISSLLAANEERQEIEARLSEAEVAANQDGMSGAWNRRAWERLTAMHMQRQARDPRPAFVVLVDLDGLKKVNDTQGHAAGDLLIKRAADTLAQSIRPYDVLARLGGDEFAILVPDCAMPATRLRRRLQAALKKADIAASIGLAFVQADINSALAAADRRMYRHKRWNRRCFNRSDARRAQRPRPAEEME